MMKILAKKKKKTGTYGFIGGLYKTYKEIMTRILKCRQKTEEERTFQNSFYLAIISLLLKADKDKTNKENQRIIFDEFRCKHPQQNISKPNPTIHKKDHTTLSSHINSRGVRMFQHMQINQWYISH